jgi:TonB family protein
MSTVVQLFIMKNGALEGTELVSGDRFVVGTDASCACVLDDPSVLGRHVGVFVHDGKLAIQDLTGGQTKVNGESFTGARYVGPREDVVVGVYTIKLKLMSAAAKSSGPTPTSPPAPSSMPPAPAPTVPPAATKPPAPAPSSMSPKPAPVSALQAKPAAAPAPAPVAQRPSGVAVGSAVDLEVTVPGLPPPPPVTDPPLGALTTDDEHTAVDPPRASQMSAAAPAAADARTEGAARKAPRAAPAPAPAAAALQTRPSADVVRFAPVFVDDDEDGDHDDEAAPWSLVQRLVRPPEGASGKNAVIEVVHHRGEHVVDHRVLHEGDAFVLGADWSKAERAERGIDKPLALVRLKKDGVAELLQAPGVQGKLLRQGTPSDLPQNGAPLVDGELASLKIGNERVFIRFAGVPKLVWSKEEAANAARERTIQILSAGASVAFLAFFVLVSWIYSYRGKSEDIIDLEDEGFAEVIEKDLAFEEPPKPEKPPEPIKTKEPAPEKQPDKTAPAPTTKAEPTPEPVKEAPKAGLAAALENIPKVNDSASAQNLNAALSNIKGVRVPGDASGFKTSALTGKGPSSGVQIGGTSGVATSGINALVRKDGAAGALTGKGDRAVAGKVVTQPRLSQVKGQGELSKDEIQRVINSHVGEIQYCYEKQLRTNTGLAGRVVLEWTVSTSGAVSGVKLATSSLSSTEATNCMMASVKKWKFPKPRGNGAVTIVYPFVFNTI